MVAQADWGGTALVALAARLPRLTRLPGLAWLATWLARRTWLAGLPWLARLTRLAGLAFRPLAPAVLGARLRRRFDALGPAALLGLCLVRRHLRLRTVAVGKHGGFTATPALGALPPAAAT